MLVNPAAIVLGWAAVTSAMRCRNLTVPVSISSRNAVFDLKPPSTEIDVTNLALGLTRPGKNFTASLLKDYKTVTGDYELAATYCQPDSGPGHAVQILTHGVGFDRSYWNFPYNNYNYSYVQRAVDAGYSTVSWDRLGIAHSSHGDPVNEIQVFLEIAALKALTDQVRGGQLCGISTKFNKTVHVGHSFGSVMTYVLSNTQPNITDAIVLTGFSQVSQFMASFVLGGNFAPVKEIPPLAEQYDAGYLAPKTSIGVHIDFFGPDDFDPELLQVAFKKGQPAAVGELLTLGAAPKESVFAGPVMIITGDYDVPFCGGNCTDTMAIKGASTSLIEYSKDSFKNASVFNATIVPGAGHGLNFGYTAPQTYRIITDFIQTHV